GWESLDQYGSFDPSPYVVNHELEGLFMMGGAHELTLDQIVKAGLYINPPMVPTCKTHMTQYHRSHDADCWRGAKPVEFPQIAGMDLQPFPCEFCERVLPTMEAKEQHQSVFHKEEKGNIQQGQSLGTSLADALRNTNLLPAQVSEESLLKRIEELKAELAEKDASETMSATVAEATTVTIEEPVGGHPHSYPKAMGSKCRTPGCTATRGTAFQARSKP
ncbi:hypothetical protein LCGC14_0378320, partial [marine sediment metagenome]